MKNYTDIRRFETIYKIYEHELDLSDQYVTSETLSYGAGAICMGIGMSSIIRNQDFSSYWFYFLLGIVLIGVSSFLSIQRKKIIKKVKNR